MNISEEKRSQGGRGKVLTLVFLTACFSFNLGLYLTGAFPRGPFSSYVAVPGHLILIIVAGFLIQRELDRLISARPTVQSLK